MEVIDQVSKLSRFTHHLPSAVRTLDVSPWILKDGGALDVDSCISCWERTAHIERYIFAVRALKDMRVLDFGCGVGFGSEMLAASGNQVIAIDTSQEALTIAKNRRGFVDNLVFGDSSELCQDEFDACVAFEVIEHLDSAEDFILNVKARHLIASVPIIPTVETNPYHKKDFTLESFRALLESRFDVRSWWLQIMPFHNKPCIAIFHGEARF